MRPIGSMPDLGPIGLKTRLRVDRDFQNNRQVLRSTFAKFIWRQNATERTMTDAQPSVAEELKKEFGGEIFLPGEPSYEDARKIWNATVDKHPALIARRSNTQDALRAGEFARGKGLRLPARGSGNHMPGNAMCDDGM